MNVLIISSFKWINITQAQAYAVAEFAFHEREYLLFFASLNPTALVRKLTITAPQQTYGFFSIIYIFNFIGIMLSVFFYGLRDFLYKYFVFKGILEEMDDFFGLTWDAKLIGPLYSNFWF